MKHLYILLLTALLASCSPDSILDKKPPYEADLDGAITNAKTAELALSGVYANLPAKGYDSRDIVAEGSFKAGTMRKPTWWKRGNAVWYYERYWPTLSSDGTKEWSYNYKTIKNTNFLLSALDNISDFQGNRKEEMMGELHFLRALAYERLMLHFCEYWNLDSKFGFIIRNELPSLSNVTKARATVAESYQIILDDLDIAIEKAPDYTSCAQASNVAAKTLKMRVLFQMNEYDECITIANELISSKKTPLADSYGTVFTDFSNTKEVIFGRVYGASESSDLETRIDVYSGGKWGPTESYIELIKDDPRYDAIIGDSVKVNYPYGIEGEEYKNATIKKLVNSSNNLPLMFLRMAEVYLIKAEAIYRNGGDYATAYEPISVLRNRAGANPVPHSTKEEIEAAICNEWLIEMSYENWHEYFALRRFGIDYLLKSNALLKEAYDKEAAVSESKKEQYYQRMVNYRISKIPTSETNVNPVDQNPGY